MDQIKFADTTLCREDSTFSFKEKIEIARQLEKLRVDVIELPEISNKRTDILLVRTLASFVNNSELSVAAGSDIASIDNAIEALSSAEHKCIRIELPVSPVGMEYNSHKKPVKMLDWITESVNYALSKCTNVEFCAVDATRAEKDFLEKAINNAVAAGASRITVCDSAAEMMPDDFAEFADSICKMVNVPVGVKCSNKNGMAAADTLLAVRKKVAIIKTSVGGDVAPLETIAEVFRNCGNNYGLSSNIKQTELHRIIKQICWITDNIRNNKNTVSISNIEEDGINLDKNDDQKAVITAVAKLGYDLSEEDQLKVYEEFLRVADKKKVGAKELEAIVASTALQVPAAYKLESYIINNGNIITASAQVTLEKDGKKIQGVCIGDGPVDAAFRAIDQIIGHHYELDDFQIQSVTEGKEAMGSAIVKLRSNGKLYSGNGISTDIIGASIRAYINAVNKIVYEEA